MTLPAATPARPPSPRARAAARVGGELPCLYSHNSDEPKGGVELTSYRKRCAEALHLNIQALVSQYGIERVGFGTITTGDSPTWEEFSDRLNNLSRRLMKEHFAAWVFVIEYHKDGDLHAHYCAAAHQDIRTGFNFHEYEKSRDQSKSLNYRRNSIHKAVSKCPALKSIWDSFRSRSEGLGIGRCEFIPVRSNADAIARYVGGYVKKALADRHPEHAGKRFIRYSAGWRVARANFAWFSVGSQLWRAKVGAFAESQGLLSMRAFSGRFGPRWAFLLLKMFLSLQLPQYATADQAQREGFDVPSHASEIAVCDALYYGDMRPDRQRLDKRINVWTFNHGRAG